MSLRTLPPAAYFFTYAYPQRRVKISKTFINSKMMLQSTTDALESKSQNNKLTLVKPSNLSKQKVNRFELIKRTEPMIRTL